MSREGKCGAAGGSQSGSEVCEGGEGHVMRCAVGVPDGLEVGVG